MTDAPPALPAGLLTFLFTDIEDSTRRWETGPDEMRRVVAHHDALLRTAIEERGGTVFKHTGDGVAAVFTSPRRAAEAAVSAMRALQHDDWGGDQRVRVRVGLHVGEAEPTRGDYLGPAVNRTARLMDIANGDQIVISGALVELLDGFDVAPAGLHQLRGIGTERVYRLSHPELLDDPRPLRARVGSSASAVPVPTHDILGRSLEIEAVTGLLEDHRVVTVVGPGGVGKSRLANEVARGIDDAFPDGVVMCDLATVGDDDAVADAIAESLGARVQPGMGLEDSIVHYLEQRRVLLLLDGIEHVITAVRDLVRRMLTVDGPSVLATSREPIALDGEQLYGLAPLDPPTAGLALFTERARERDAHFALGPGDEESIREICFKVDGMPLGIELAAAWVRVLSLADLADQLDDRFRILRGGQRGGRHETLRDTIRWSYEQLDDTQARLFARLSVFSGGFSLEAVEVVCGPEIAAVDLLDLLMALVDKSMVVTERGVGQIRFTMLGTLRQFAQEQLDEAGESDEYRRRHASYFSRLAEERAARLLSDEEPEVWDLLGREWANIRAALDTLLDADRVDEAADLIVAVAWYSGFAMRFEAYAWATELWPRIDEHHPRAGALLGVRALEAYFRADDAAVELAERGLALDPVDPTGVCRAALAAHYLNNVHAAEDSAALTESWLAHLDRASPVDRLWADGFRVFHLVSHDPSPEALERARLMVESARASGSATSMALARWAYGMAVATTDRDRAVEIWDDGLDVARSLNPRHLVVHLLIGLQLHFTASHGELAATLARCRDTLRLALDHHYLAGTSHLFGVTAIVLARAGRARTGAQLLGCMLANGHVPRPNAARAIDRALGDDAAADIDRGRKLAINDAATMAIEALSSALEEVDA